MMSAAQMLPMTATTSVSTLLAPTGVSAVLGIASIQMGEPALVNIKQCIASKPFYSHLHCLVDINECAEATDNCDQVCHNNIGSFTCTCIAGATLSPNGYSCIGIEMATTPYS